LHRLHARVVGLPRCRGGRSVDSGVELQERQVRLCRDTALHYASSNGHTETAMALVKAGADVHCKDNDGYGCTGCMLVSLGRRQCRGGRSVESGVELQERLVCCAGIQRCTMRRGTATRRRRWRWSRRARTCTARTTTGTVQPSGCIVVSLGRRQCGGGRSVNSGVELQERLLRLRRSTALHYASLNGHTETAMALVKAGADVHCKDNDGYG
jgi:hypothetical protein